ncbi:MAG: hypothetical protein J6I54_02755 [Bacteroidaceae bacterium]|nr:hypothetical protein [Bacteroidaceae bacterium]
MKTAIRYYSKFGHTRKMAATVSGKLGVPAESIERPVTEHIDTLYFGSAIYAAVVDWRVKKFIKTLTPDKVGRVICFSSAAIIDSNYQKVKALFEKQGIPVDERQFTCRGSMGPIHAGHPDKADHEALAAFIESTI